VFVFDTGTGELTRAGKRLHLPDQAARLLTLLLENPGMMVSREELKAALWPEGEFLDYDRSINRAVSQLRAILHDRSSKNISVIDTLPKRGYRFMIPVTEISDSGLAPAPSAPQSPADAAAVTEAQSLAPRLSLKWRLWGVGVGVAVLMAVVAGLWLARRPSPVPDRPLSLGIVPFETSGEAASTMAEGFRLNLADVLAQSPEIEIRAVHSFDHLNQDESQVLGRAQQLGVDLLLFGKFTVTGNLCLLRLELVRSRDGVHLSSFQYSGAKEELAAISDKVERDLFDRLRLYENTARPGQGRPASTKAYAAYLRGRAHLSRWTDEELLQAVDAFQEALKEDPSYARAYADQASAYFVLSQHGAGDSDKYMEMARASAAKALALDPTLAEAHAMLGRIALNKDWDFKNAEVQLHRAVELDPNHAIYRQWLAILYGLEGKYDLALQEIDKAHAADPERAPVFLTEIFLAGSARQFDRADRAVASLLRMMPDWSLAHEQAATTLWIEGRYPQAIAEWRQAAVLDKMPDRVRLEDQGAEAFRSGGVAAYARLRLQAIATHKGISHEEDDFVPAEWHAYAGDWNQVLTELDQMVTRHSRAALLIAANPAFAPLHRDPRYLHILERTGIPLTSEQRMSQP
jgi:DNA-binding winged helix-turn-helix (wHTH) protein/tetratricopeptide (TPR) repeat protein